MDTDEQPTIVPIAPLPQSAITPLPGVVALIKMGFGIYRERLGALIGVGVLQSLAWLIFLVPIALIFLFKVNMAVDMVIMFITSIIGIGIYSWLMLASMEIIRGHTQQVTLQQALSTTFAKVLPFLWMLLTALLVFIGTGTLFSLLSFSILSTLGHFSGISIFTIISTAAAIISWLIVGILFSIWFMFFYWVFVDEEKRGIHALVASRELVRKDVGAIFWRLFAATFLVSSLYYLVSLFNSLFFSGMLRSSISFLLAISSALFFAPIIISIVYELYRSVKARVGDEVQENKKLYKYFMGYAIFGIVSIILVIVMALIIVMSGYLPHMLPHA